MSVVKWSLVLVLLAVAIAATVLFVVTRVENQQARQNATRLAQGAPATADTGAAVVYFSRSGNTAVAAQHVARQLNARLYRLEADDYTLGLTGLVTALHDARSHEADIAPTTLDLDGVRTLVLGSPIWLYSPAPPIWEFARNTRMDGMDVVLFNTFNSKFEQRFIDDFRAIVMSQGAKSFAHRFVKRGRMGQQLSTDELLQGVDSVWALPD